MNKVLIRISVEPKTQNQNHAEYYVTRYLTLCTQWPCMNDDVTHDITLYSKIMKCEILGRKT
jgi:hypothetical protein